MTELAWLGVVRHGESTANAAADRAEAAGLEVIDIAERANQIIVTDYTDNIRLIGEMIKQLDIPAGGDSVIEFYSLKHSEAEELGALLTLVLNSQPAPPPSPPPQ